MISSVAIEQKFPVSLPRIEKQVPQQRSAGLVENNAECFDAENCL